ncbi:hypothetical protein HID58_009089 [Brassica napus]|uniref:Uncharacterized protein n=1 Tax=Brassica napus TaxID=3708 RepID=A0ABQ8DSC1_BRANA|nr:hypothetical protein HID58_009089 [Brassica napus]
MDGSLSSLISPDQYRCDCFAQFKDMKAMDPMELLEREMVLAGNHRRSQFYKEFLGLAKAVWLLHLLRPFSLDPSPSHYEANCGAEFHSQYMESVVRFLDGLVPAG